MFETESDKTPLQQKLDEFGQQLSKVSVWQKLLFLNSVTLSYFVSEMVHGYQLFNSFDIQSFQCGKLFNLFKFLENL